MELINPTIQVVVRIKPSVVDNCQAHRHNQNILFSLLTVMHRYSWEYFFSH